MATASMTKLSCSACRIPTLRLARPLSVRRGTRAVTVTRIAGDLVTLDGNHPLAGKSLHFQVEVTGVRAATTAELSHGHVHSPGGHHQ